MLRSVNDLKGFEIVATDGEIGDVEQFYFDDERWTLRYIVVNTGNWLSGRQVLISPFSVMHVSPLSVMHVDREHSKLQVNLTKSQVEKSPNIDTHKPVSRQMEAAHADYYGYPYYWGSPFLWGAEELPVLASRRSATAMATATAHPTKTGVTTDGRTTTAGTAADMRVISEDVHLRSTQEVASYHIAATDGEIGHVEDFILDVDSWTIRYLAIDTRNWLPGKKVIVSPQWIAAIDWAQGKVHIDLSREGVKQSPEYDSSTLISREYEEQLYQHYRQPGYWPS
jgi:sporulation protein YlmC with PRC-barrel domain